MLEVKDLVKSYGTGKNQNKVLRGVNFTIHKGEFVAVMGPSGSGKNDTFGLYFKIQTIRKRGDSP